MSSNQPLCTAGRCASILSAIAEAKTMQRLTEQYGEALAAVVRSVLAEFGVDASDEAVAESVRRHLREAGTRHRAARR